MQLRFSLKGRLKLTAALRLQMGMSPQSNLLHCQQTLTSRLTLLLWACWRLSLGCKKHLGSFIPKVPRPPPSLFEKESGKHEPAHTGWAEGGPYACPCGRGCYRVRNGNVEQMVIYPSLRWVFQSNQQARDTPKGLGGYLKSLLSLFQQNCFIS